MSFITKADLRKAHPDNVRRLARSLNVQNLDKMSDKQLIRFLVWLFSREDKRRSFRNIGWD